MKVFKKLIEFLKKEPDLTIIDVNINQLKIAYAESEFKEQGILLNFPSIVSLANSDINAAYMLTLVNEKSFFDLYEILNTDLNVDIKNEPLEKTERFIENSFISFLRVQKDFGGYFIGLVTNDLCLLNKIMQANLEVVPPWIATKLDPEDFLFPQGKEEFYWNTFWLRFYESMNEQDLEKYLSKYEIPLKWQEYFEVNSSLKNHT